MKNKGNLILFGILVYTGVSVLFAENTYSRYAVQHEKSDTAHVCIMETTTNVMSLGEIKGHPGVVNLIPISISNTDENKVAEVDLEYEITLTKLADNLPLEYTICSDANGEVELGKTVTCIANANHPTDINYTVKISWPSQFNDAKYAEKIDAFDVIVKAYQIN